MAHQSMSEVGTDLQNPALRKKKIGIGIVAAVVIGAVVLKLTVLRESFRYAGTLEATQVDLSAQVSSTIRKVHVQEGEHVTKDQFLAQLSCEDIDVAARQAKENYERTLRLFKSGTTSKEVLDQMKFKDQDAQVRWSWCAIRSPLDGLVLSRYREPGEWVSPGTKLLTLANIQDIWATIYVPQPVVARLSHGQKLSAIVPEIPGRPFQGSILRINAEAEFTPKNVQTRAERERLVYGVKVSFLGANEDEILKPGMTIEIELPED